jgi:hypothetical protein
MNRIGKKIINDRRNNHESYKKTTGLIKEIKGKKTKNVSPDCEMIAEQVIQCNECREKINEKSVIEQQRIGRIIRQLVD